LTAPRMGLDSFASSPKAIDRVGSALTRALPSASSTSSSVTPRYSAASFTAFSRTFFAASLTALPATTAPRLANVPVPQWN
jgi:hypothetical protein